MLLFEHPLSPSAQKVKIVLRETVPFGVERPAPVDDTVSIFESTIIMEYFEERWP